MNPQRVKDRQQARRAMYAARKRMARQMAVPPCQDCQVSLWGNPVRCLACQRRHEQEQRAADAREAKAAESVERVERLLRQAEARRRRIGRMSLSDVECWGGAGVSAIYHEGGL